MIIVFSKTIHPMYPFEHRRQKPLRSEVSPSERQLTLATKGPYILTLFEEQGYQLSCALLHECGLKTG